MNPRTRTTLIAAALLLSLTAGPATTAVAAPHPATPTTGATARSGLNVKALRAAMAGLPTDHATAALVRVGGSDGSWRGSAGVRDLVTGRKAIEDGRFRAGSTTKVVTAALVLQLAAEGEVDLNTPVQRYLPGLLPADGPKAFLPITVRQLLNHTSGIQSGDGLGDTTEELYEHRFETLTPEEVVASAVAKGPTKDFVPGKKQEYLNINYTVLAMLIEKVTGSTYEREAARRIFKPLGMHHTSFPGADPRIHGPHNRGYQILKQADGTTVLRDATVWNQADRWAAGDMISTTADLERLLFALFRGEVVPRPQLKEMFTLPAGIPGATMSAGLEYYKDKKTGQELWLKSGGRYGYNALIAATPDLSRTLVYSVNATDAKAEGMNPVAEGIVRATFLS